MPSPLTAPLIAWLSRLSYPRMFMVVGALFFINLFIPDPIILIDELLLGLATITLAKWKRGRSETDPKSKAPLDGDARRR
ncbi:MULTISPECIES: DUF6116 family protein [Luteimonas]|uniref:DUF6116 family protein n=1 Tax=Luteimonas TaxID=83614 RepID=UPI000C7A91C7|nr:MULTISPECIES: DUF6116 family protein [Luteimonas]